MKVITEADLRSKCLKQGDTVLVCDGDYLTQEAKKYMEVAGLSLVCESGNQKPMPLGKKPEQSYISEDGKTRYREKPEHMTHLRDNILIPKSSARIRYRGILDYAQAKTVEAQALAERKGLPKVADDLQSVLAVLRKLMACDVNEEPLGELRILGLGEKEIREMSHNPREFSGTGHVLPDKSQGELCACVNTLRTIVRQAELASVDAYGAEGGDSSADAVLTLNRLSSAVYIVWCRLLADYYK